MVGIYLPISNHNQKVNMEFQKVLEKAIKDEEELEIKFNSICRTHLAKNHLLKDLTTEELFIWLVGKTYNFGRSFDDSIENAKCLFQKPRQDIEKQFGTK